MDTEKMTLNTDFSKFSKIRESLRQKLLAERERRMGEMSMDELDMIAAAGTVRRVERPVGELEKAKRKNK